jgi:hypothetical protein
MIAVPIVAGVEGAQLPPRISLFPMREPRAVKLRSAGVVEIEGTVMLRHLAITRLAIARLSVVLFVGLVPVKASAVINQAVEDACQAEYLTYCFGMKIPSEPLRACFRANMYKLSLHCAKALLDNGEATQADMKKYLAATGKKK